MTSPTPHRRFLVLISTLVVFSVVVIVVACQKTPESPAPEKDKDDKAEAAWPLFGGSPSRNLVNLTEKNVATTWSVKKGAEKNIKWSVDLGTKAYGGPVFARGKIYIGTNRMMPRNPEKNADKGVLVCLRQNDGSFVWQAVHDKLPAGQVSDWPDEGICSSPVIDGNRLYYVSNRCEVNCADTEGDPEKKTDKVIWKLDMIGKFNVFPHNLATCSPLIAGDTLFVITSNGVAKDHITIPSPEAPSFLAIDKKTGDVKWKDNSPSVRAAESEKAKLKELVDKGLVLMHGQWSNPVYAEPNGKPQIIFPGGDGWIYSFEPATGKLIWKFDCNPKDAVYKLGPEGTRNDFLCTPVVADNKLYVGTGQDPEHDKGVGHLWCIDITKEPKNKDKDLSPVDKKFDPKAEVNKDSGLVWHYGGMVPETDKEYERDYYFGRTMSTCSVHDGLVYAAEYDGILHCLDAKTGKHYWEHKLGGDTWSSPYWVDGKVYLGNENGTMTIFAHGKEKKILSTIEMGGKIRVTPVAFQGVLYMITENPCKLWAITSGK
jgi:outer membrane protein assembly factor BamB